MGSSHRPVLFTRLVGRLGGFAIVGGGFGTGTGAAAGLALRRIINVAFSKRTLDVFLIGLIAPPLDRFDLPIHAENADFLKYKSQIHIGEGVDFRGCTPRASRALGS